MNSRIPKLNKLKPIQTEIEKIKKRNQRFKVHVKYVIQNYTFFSVPYIPREQQIGVKGRYQSFSPKTQFAQ